VSASWDDNQDDELMSMHKFSFHDEDPLEKTIRPGWKADARLEKSTGLKPQDARKMSASSSSSRKGAASGQQRQKSRSKSTGNKFELPSRPDLAYREQSIEDYSDIFGDNDQDDLVFNHRLSQMKKVSRPSRPSRSLCVPKLNSVARCASALPSF
jgi:hypothetical protein